MKGNRLMSRRLGKYLSSLTKPELDKIKEELNLTDDEEIIFNELSKGRSRTKVAEICSVSTATVSNRIKDIKRKLNKIGGADIE